MIAPTPDRHYLDRDGECVYALHFGKHRPADPGVLGEWRALNRFAAPVPATATTVGNYPNHVLLVVTEGPATSIEFVGRQPQRTIGYRLRNPDLESAALPFEITPEQWGQLPDADEIAVSRDRYQALREDDPDQQPEVVTVDLTECRPIPLGWEPAPELPDGLAWEPAPAYAALWGPTLAPHLVPGHLTGCRNAVLDRVAEHPWVRRWTSAGSSSGHPLLSSRNEVTFYFDRRYEGDQTETVMVKLSPRARKKVARERVRTSSEWIRDVKAPADMLPGVNLADALSRLPGYIEAELDRILPHEGHICGHCNGAGFVIEEPAG